MEISQLPPLPDKPLWMHLEGESGKNCIQELTRREVTLEQEIGRGTYGRIFRSTLKYGEISHVVLVKRMEKGSTSLADFLREGEVLTKLKCPEIVRCYGCCSQVEPILLVFEFMNEGDLLQYLREGAEKGRNMNVQGLVEVSTQIARGMAYLEKCNIIHRDISARNILVNDDGNNGIVAKIAEFSLSVELKRKEDSILSEGTKFPIKWSAPEVITTGRHTFKSDVWSFGILLWEIFKYGATPYPGMVNLDVVEQVCNQGHRMQPPENCPKNIQILMQMCWLDEGQRPFSQSLSNLIHDKTLTRLSTQNSLPPAPPLPVQTHPTVSQHSVQPKRIPPPLRPAKPIGLQSAVFNIPWEIKRDTLSIEERVGGGHFADILRGSLDFDRTVYKVAIKRMKPGSMPAASFLREANMMKKLRSKNASQIVYCYGCCSKEEPILIVLEYMERGNLKQYLREGEGRELDLSQAVNIAKQIAGGMDYLGECNLVHRDVAARNILVGGDKIVKISDFGLSVDLGGSKEWIAPKGNINAKLPIKWMAPEAVFFGIFSVKSDVWSFGVLLMEIMTGGRTPYPDLKHTELLKRLDDGYRMPKPEKCPDSLYQIMLQCWHKDVRRRPTFSNLSQLVDNCTTQNVASNHASIFDATLEGKRREDDDEDEGYEYFRWTTTVNPKSSLQDQHDDSDYVKTPLEILARGPKATEAYEKAVSSGSIDLYRTRLVLVGQERVGKTSLLKNLLQIPFDEDEAVTDGVQMSAQFSLEVQRATNWGERSRSSAGRRYRDALIAVIAEELHKYDKNKGPVQDQEDFQTSDDINSDQNLNENVVPSLNQDKTEETATTEEHQEIIEPQETSSSMKDLLIPDESVAENLDATVQAHGEKHSIETNKGLKQDQEDFETSDDINSDQNLTENVLPSLNQDKTEETTTTEEHHEIIEPQETSSSRKDLLIPDESVAENIDLGGKHSIETEKSSEGEAESKSYFPDIIRETSVSGSQKSANSEDSKRGKKKTFKIPMIKRLQKLLQGGKAEKNSELNSKKDLTSDRTRKEKAKQRLNEKQFRVEACHCFKAVNEDEISVAIFEELTLIKATQADRFRVSNMKGDTGHIPSSVLIKLYVVAGYSFKAIESEDLSFVESEKLTILNSHDLEHWWLAVNKIGRVGLVPNNYFIKFDVKASDDYNAFHTDDLSVVKSEELSLYATQEHRFLVSNNKGDTGYIPSFILAKFHAVAKFSYETVTPDELGFFESEEFVILNTIGIEENWWLAFNSSGSIGFVPSNFCVVKEERKDQSLQNESASDSKDNSSLMKLPVKRQESIRPTLPPSIPQRRPSQSMTDSDSDIEDPYDDPYIVVDKLRALVQSGTMENQGQTEEDIQIIREDILQSVASYLSKLGHLKSTEDIVLSIWDFAGQELYYTTHQVFLSRRAVFLVVFDLSQDLHKQGLTDDPRALHYFRKLELTGLEFLDFWMRSIYTFTAFNDDEMNTTSGNDMQQRSPPIFIVGTHKNCLGKTVKERNRKVAAKFATIRKYVLGKCYQEHIVTRYYAIENSLEDFQDREVVKLRSDIEDVALKEPYMGEKIPLQWLLFEHRVAKMIQKGTKHITLLQAKELTESEAIETEEELTTMLQFYHDLGSIIYFGDRSENLKNLIVLDPQWLIDVFSKVITVMDSEDQRALDINAWVRLDEDGILEEKLLDTMWKDVLDEDPNQKQEMKEALIELMEKFDLLCEKHHLTQVTGASNEPNRSFYVPSRLQFADECETEDKPDANIFYIDFHGFLPDGFFHRIMARAAMWAQTQGGLEPKLRFRHGVFFADDYHEFILHMSSLSQARIKVSVSRAELVGKSGDAHPSPLWQASNKVKTFLSTVMEDLKLIWAKGIEYTFTIECPCGKGELHSLNLDVCLIRAAVPCVNGCRILTDEIQSKFMDKSKDDDGEAKEALLEDVMTDIYLTQLSERLGKEWTSLATGYLGFTLEQLFHITTDHPFVLDQMSTMLVNWRQKQSQTEINKAVNTLADALSSCNREDLAEYVRKLIDV